MVLCDIAIENEYLDHLGHFGQMQVETRWGKMEGDLGHCVWEYLNPH